MFDDIFHRRKLNINKLVSYGFKQKENCWIYGIPIMNNTFTLHITVSDNGDVDTDLIENEFNEPYVLYKTNASGSFVGKVRSEIRIVLTSISEECFEPAVFKTEQAMLLTDYVRDTYGDELEFLWTKSPDNAVWRRKDNKKWYGAILTVSGNKLGLPTDEILEIIDLKLQKELMEATVDGKRYFPGWHMNKKNWYTIVLNNCVPTEEICHRIDESYRLAQK